MKVVGIIPARYQSSRFPGKPLIDLKGKSMIQRVYENAKKTKGLSQVIVATDDKRIYDHVISFNGEVMMTASSHTSGTDRCGEIAGSIEADVIINIQGDEPLLDPLQIEEIIKAFSSPDVKIATLATPKITLEDIENPNRIKVVLNNNNNAIYFSRSPIPNTYHANKKEGKYFPFLRHIGLYAFKKDVLLELVKLEKTILEQTESLEQLRWMYYNYPISVVQTTIETPNIDTPEDVKAVLEILEREVC